MDRTVLLIRSTERERPVRSGLLITHVVMVRRAKASVRLETVLLVAIELETGPGVSPVVVRSCFSIHYSPGLRLQSHVSG